MGKPCERGQALPIAGFLIGVMLLVGVLIAHVGAAANVAAQVQTAADAAALAGVKSGEEAARSAASANGAALETIQHNGNYVTVEVVVGERSAKARARLDGGLAEAKG